MCIDDVSGHVYHWIFTFNGRLRLYLQAPRGTEVANWRTHPTMQMRTTDTHDEFRYIGLQRRLASVSFFTQICKMHEKKKRDVMIN